MIDIPTKVLHIITSRYFFHCDGGVIFLIFTDKNYFYYFKLK